MKTLTPRSKPKLELLENGRWMFHCTCGRSFEPPPARGNKDTFPCKNSRNCHEQWIVYYDTKKVFRFGIKIVELKP